MKSNQNNIYTIRCIIFDNFLIRNRIFYQMKNYKNCQQNIHNTIHELFYPRCRLPQIFINLVTSIIFQRFPTSFHPRITIIQTKSPSMFLRIPTRSSDHPSLQQTIYPFDFRFPPWWYPKLHIPLEDIVEHACVHHPDHRGRHNFRTSSGNGPIVRCNRKTTISWTMCISPSLSVLQHEFASSQKRTRTNVRAVLHMHGK